MMLFMLEIQRDIISLVRTKMNNYINDITIVVPTKNDINLENCLEAASKHFKNIIVVESGDVDTAKLVCARHGAKCVYFEWNGKFPKKRNWLLKSSYITTPWVLFLDSDEYITSSFIKGLKETWSQNRNYQYDGFWIEYSNFFMDKQLNFGVPQRKLALFKVAAGEFEKVAITEGDNFDMEVHEHPIIKGSTSSINGKIKHHDFRGLEQFLIKHIEYAKWEADRFCRANFLNTPLTVRQKIKYKLMPSSILGGIYFILTYFLYLGFLDGHAGYSYARIKAFYFYTIHLLIKEKIK